MSKWKILGYDVQEVQEKIFEIFLEFDRICQKHKIRYTLEGGTLLGAVLYQDFIPWDDDMDVIMLRADYDRFCAVVDQEIREPFTFCNMDRNPEYPFLFGKMYNKDTVYEEANASHLNIPHGVFLDIFIEDNIKLRTKKLHCQMVSAIGTVKYLKHKMIPFRAKYALYFPLFFFSIRGLNRLADKIMRRHDGQETAYIYPLCESVSSKPPLPRRMLTQLEKGTFHGKEVDVPVCRMWYLHKHYETPMEIPPEASQHPTHGVIKVQL